MSKCEEKILNIYGATISVYSDGSVWNHRGSKGYRHFGSKTPRGYRVLHIIDNGTRRTVFVHRLVATAFIDNPLNKPQVNHKDGNKENNSIENLEWCTNSENMWHKTNVLESFSSMRPVMCIETGIVYKTTSEAARENNVKRCNIWRSATCEPMRFGTNGLHWKFI